MNTYGSILFVILAMATSASHAQGSRAVENVALQVKALRSAMQSFSDNTRSEIGYIKSELTAFTQCAQKTKIYAPTNPNADNAGCVSTTLIGQTMPPAENCGHIALTAMDIIVLNGKVVAQYGGTTRVGCNYTYCARHYDGISFSSCQCEPRRDTSYCR